MTNADFAQFWPVFRAIIAAEVTYALEAEMDFSSAQHFWIEAPQKTFAAHDREHQLPGSYYLKPNAAGPGNHICNCGYMVAPAARSQGMAKKNII